MNVATSDEVIYGGELSEGQGRAGPNNECR